MWIPIIAIIAITFSVGAIVFAVLAYSQHESHHHRTLQVDVVARRSEIDQIRHGSIVSGRKLEAGNHILSYNSSKNVEMWTVRRDLPPKKHLVSHSEYASIIHGQSSIPILDSHVGVGNRAFMRDHGDPLTLMYEGITSDKSHLIPYTHVRSFSPVLITIHFYRGIENSTGTYRCNMDLKIDIPPSSVTDTTPVEFYLLSENLWSTRGGSSSSEEFIFRSGFAHTYAFHELAESLVIGRVGTDGFQALESHTMKPVLTYVSTAGGVQFKLVNAAGDVVTVADIASLFTLKANESVRVDYNVDA